MRYLLAILLLCSPCGAKELVTPDRLELVGGYRVPLYDTNANPHVSRSSGYPWGGMAAYTFSSGEVVVWHENGEQGGQVIESRSTTPMGAADTPPAQWPLLEEARSPDRVWTKGELFGNRASSGFVIPQGLAFDPEGNRLWVSARSTYATGPDPIQWLAAIEYPSRTVSSVIPKLTLSAQSYGGGLGIIPRDFADKYLGGRRLGFLSGGYESGQRASSGPTLAAIPLEPQSEPQPIELMRWFTTAQVGSTPFVQGHPYVCQSFPDYTSTMPWHYPVTNGVGYWPGNTIRGNGAWVDTPTISSVCYMAVRGAGAQTYAAQTEGGGAPRRNSLYVFDPQAFAEVAQGTAKPVGVARERYQFYDWSRDSNGGIPNLARSLSFDAGSGLLWIYYPQAWTKAGFTGKFPIVAAYRVKEVEQPIVTKKLRVISGEWAPGNVVEVEELTEE